MRSAFLYAIWKTRVTAISEERGLAVRPFSSKVLVVVLDKAILSSDGEVPMKRTQKTGYANAYRGAHRVCWREITRPLSLSFSLSLSRSPGERADMG